MLFEYDIGLGGNLGDPAAQMSKAVQHLLAYDKVDLHKCSKLYRTPPWGNLKQPHFLNACIRISSKLMPDELLYHCQQAELAQNRIRDEKWGPRTVDLDIILWSQGVYKSKNLNIPHKHLKERAFVLKPLLDIDPDMVIGKDPIDDLLSNLGVFDMEVLEDEEWLIRRLT